MKLRRVFFFGTMILVLLGVGSFMMRPIKTAEEPVPVPETVADLHFDESMNGRLNIHPDNNSICYTVEVHGIQRSGEIRGPDFLAMRANGEDDVINGIYLSYVRREIEAINAVLASLSPIVRDEAFAQITCEDCGGGGCASYTYPGRYQPPLAGCQVCGNICQKTIYCCPSQGGCPQCA